MMVSFLIHHTGEKMATIALYANRINQMPLLLNDFKSSVLTYQAELLNLNVQLLNISCSVCDVEDVIKSVQAATQTQEQKAASIDSIAKNNDDFIAEVVSTDNSVAALINQRKDDFYATYTYLRPNHDTFWLEWAAKGLVSSTVWCIKVWEDLWDWILGPSHIELQTLEPEIIPDLCSPKPEPVETSGSVLPCGGVCKLFVTRSEEEYLAIAEEALRERELKERLELNEKIEAIQLEITEIDVVEKGNERSKDAMFSRSLPEVLARMIYQEQQNCENGGQSQVLWVVVNRIFTDENHTRSNPHTLQNVLYYGEFESLTINNKNGTYNAFHPDYNSKEWENAKFLASLLCALVGDEEKANLDEDYVRETLSNFQDLQGNYITNEIGDCDAFWGDGRNNHFYIFSEGRK